MKPSRSSQKTVKPPTASLPISSQVDDPIEPCAFYEYQWDGPKRRHVHVWEPRQTTFFVVFDGKARHMFSTARIVLYYRNTPENKVQPNTWDIQQVGSVTHTFNGDGISNAPRNDSSLPMLTVAFEVVTGGKSSNSPFGTVVLRSPAAQDLSQDSTHILFECTHSLTPHSLSLSVSFTHSTMLYTILASGCRDHFCSIHRISEIEYVTTRIVRVLPPAFIRPKVTNACLPTELLLKVFKDNELCGGRHDDLLSFAQVCRAWSCSMDILHPRLSFSDSSTHEGSKFLPRQLLDTFALAKALREKPILGLGFRHLTTNILGNPEDSEDGLDPLSPGLKSLSPFTSALIAILRATKNLQHLHLAQLDASQVEALLTTFQDLRDMRTFSLGDLQGELSRLTHKRRCPDRTATTLNVSQLSRCIAKWPALKSIKVHHLHPSTLGLRRYTLRAPTCALTQLTITRSHVSDKDLMHLFGASAKTLEHVTFDRVDGLTNAGLLAFLLAISQGLVTLTLLDAALPPVRQWGNLVIGRSERALDIVIDKMPRLRQLVISGDVASEFMLDRRSKMYLSGLDSEDTRIPVVQLLLEDVPRLCGFEANWKWPGWNTPERPARR